MSRGGYLRSLRYNLLKKDYNTMPICKGKSMYAYITNTDTGPEGTWDAAWKITVFFDSAMAKVIKDSGIPVVRTDEMINEDEAAMGQYKAAFTRKEMKTGKGAGKKNTQPFALNADGTPLEEILGNGSDVEVEYNVYNWTYNGRKGASGDFQGVTVTNLVEFVPKDNEDEEDASGSVNEPVVKEEKSSAPVKEVDEF
jgi:hypothetical protein